MRAARKNGVVVRRGGGQQEVVDPEKFALKKNLNQHGVSELITVSRL
jgi:hypothetical protein